MFLTQGQYSNVGWAVDTNWNKKKAQAPANIGLSFAISDQTSPVFLPKGGRYVKSTRKRQDDLSAMGVAGNDKINALTLVFYVFVYIRIM